MFESSTALAFVSAYWIILILLGGVLLAYQIVFLISVPKSLRRIAKVLEIMIDERKYIDHKQYEGHEDYEDIDQD